MFYNARWYDVYLNHFTQPDTIIPNPNNVLDWNRYSYVRYNPLKYTDPSGHNPQCGPDGIWCDPTVSFSEKYNVTFTGEMNNWTKKNIRAAEEAVIATAAALCDSMNNCSNPVYAFRKIYSKGMKFEWRTNCYWCRSREDIERCGGNFAGSCAAGGAVTLSSSHIMISSLSQHSDPQRDFIRRRNNIVHELGHAFDQIMGEQPRLAVSNGWANLQRGDVEGENYGFASALNVRDWQQNPANENHEVFADMFLGWVFNRWATNPTGDYRQSWMNVNMSAWVNR